MNKAIFNFYQEICPMPGIINMKKPWNTSDKAEVINGIILVSFDGKRKVYVEGVAVELCKSKKKVKYRNAKINIQLGADQRRIRNYRSLEHIKYNEKVSFYVCNDKKYLCLLVPHNKDRWLRKICLSHYAKLFNFGEVFNSMYKSK